MAIQTKRIVQFDGGTVFWEYDYEDGATGAVRRVTQIRCTNNCTGELHGGVPQPTTGTLVVLANGRTLSRTVQPGNTLDEAVPGQAATRLDITVDARGRVDGIDHRFGH
jgi:hypothetical protein